MLSKIFNPFVEKAPVSVMARAAMERLLSPLWINEVFKKTPPCQHSVRPFCDRKS